jgi:hypothetical protein
VYEVRLDEKEEIAQLWAWFGDFIVVHCQHCLWKFNTMALREKN